MTALSPAAQELLRRRAGRAQRIPPRADPGPVPLTPAQLPLAVFALREPRATPLHLEKRVRIEGALEPSRLTAAFAALVARHESLRSAIVVVDGRPAASVVARSPPIACVDLRGERPEAIEAAFDEYAHRPFDLAHGELARLLLARVDEAVWELQLTFHHLAFDGWSNAILFDELAALYRGDALPPLSLQHADLAAWLAARPPERDLAWWREALRGHRSASVPDGDRLRPARASWAAGTTARRVPVGPLRALAAGQRTTLFAVVAAAVQLLVARRCGPQDRGAPADPLLGVVVAGRHEPASERMIGNFMVALPLVAAIDPEAPFFAHVDRVHAFWRDASAHADVSVQAHARELLPEWSPERGALFPVLLNFRNLPEARPRLDGVAVGPLRARQLGTLVDLQFIVSVRDGHLDVELVHALDRFDAATAERWIDGLVALLDAIARDANVALGALPILPGDEREAVLRRWNDAGPGAPDALVHAAIWDHPATAPALRDRDGVMSYGSLTAAADALAAHLARLGAGVGARVGLCVGRTRALPIGMFGVLASGAAFVPLDPQHPDARLTAIARDAALIAVVSDAEHATRAAGFGLPVLLAEPTSAAVTPPEPSAEAAHRTRARPDDIAYIAYTSGSTGAPKGVVVEHRSAAVYVADRRRRFALGPGARVHQTAPLGFDVCLGEVLSSASAGAELVLVSRPVLLEPDALVAHLEANAVTHAGFTPTLLATLPADAPDRLTRLAFVTIGGAAAPAELFHHWRRPFRRVFNEYGPTECTIFCAYEEIGDDAPIGIGRALDGSRLYVLDRDRAPLPIGVTGDLWIAGRSVARGYLGAPELSAERFVPDPFTPGERMYRSGDLARWLPRGSVELLGRVDRQLKVRGQRVEPGEIEATLRAHPAITDAVVRLLGDELVAWYAAPAPLPPSVLSDHTRALLPSSMWPRAFVHVARLPITATGKIDERALPPPDASAAPRRAALQDPLHIAIARIWRELLPGVEVGPDDDFFDVGGHSLLAAQLGHAIARDLGCELPLGPLLERATIRQIAADVRATTRRRPPSERRLVDVQPGTPGHAPLFFIHHDLTGVGAYLRGVAAAIGPDVPLVAVAPLSPWSAVDLRAIAAVHVAAMRARQPRGPYRLGGFCVGGLVAYEIAHQLESAGERVDFVALVDSRPRSPTGPFADAIRLLARALPAERRAAFRWEWLARLARLQRTSRPELFGRLVTGLRRKVGLAPEAKVTTVGDPDPAAGDVSASIQRYLDLAVDYVAPRLRARVDVLAGPLVVPHLETVAALSDDVHVTTVTTPHERVIFDDLPAFIAAVLTRARAPR